MVDTTTCYKERFKFFSMEHRMSDPSCKLMGDNNYLTSWVCGKCVPGLGKLKIKCRQQKVRVKGI